MDNISNALLGLGQYTEVEVTIPKLKAEEYIDSIREKNIADEN